MAEEIIIDAEDSVMGRIATFAAKQALLGKKIIILNCEKAIVTGDRKMIEAEFREKSIRGGTAQKGPYFSRNPERIMKRVIRGMLPYKKQRGATAFENIKCFKGIPENYLSSEKINVKRPIKSKYIHLSQLKK